MTFEDLIGSEPLPTGLTRRLRNMELSPSAVSINVGTDLDARRLGARHETMVCRTWDLERMYVDGLAGRITGAFVTIPTLTDPSLAPAGEHVVMVQAIGARESGETRADDRRIANELLRLAEDVLPGLRDHITFAEWVKTGDGEPHPRVQRVGPIYGWMLAPEQSGVHRLPQTTPIPGLFLAGQWSGPAPGILWVMESGIQAARLALGASASAAPLPLGIARAAA